MATYRVGESGATVFNEKGEAIARLRPGHVVVEGFVDTPGSSADQYRKLKQHRGYADKMIRPSEDKGSG